MGFLTWATNFVCMFYNNIGGLTALYAIGDTIGKHIFNLFEYLGKAVNILGK